MRLAAVTVCLLAAGAGVMVVAGSLATRDALVRQAGQQLRSYTGQLARYPFLLTPLSRAAPGPPGLSRLASTGTGNLSVEVRSAGGQLVLRAGTGRPAGPGLPAPAVRVLADHREAGTVRVSHGGSLLAIAVPVHYRAHRIPYAYSAEDFTLDVTSPAGRGTPGTLLVSLSLAGVGRATEPPGRHPAGHSGIVVLATGWLAAGMTRAALRPLTRLADRAEGIAAGQPPAGCPPGRPVRTGAALDAALSRLEPARDPGPEPGAPAWRAAERQRQAIEDTSRGAAQAAQRPGRPGRLLPPWRRPARSHRLRPPAGPGGRGDRADRHGHRRPGARRAG